MHRRCKACEKWIRLYEEERARRIDAEVERDTQKRICRSQRESFNKRLSQMSKAFETRETPNCGGGTTVSVPNYDRFGGQGSRFDWDSIV